MLDFTVQRTKEWKSKKVERDTRTWTFQRTKNSIEHEGDNSCQDLKNGLEVWEIGGRIEIT